MATYKKSDMVYDDYSWTAYGDDDPEVTGAPDDTLFNRKEGYEVLYLINNLAANLSSANKEDLQNIERLIHDKLPGNYRSQRRVMGWLLSELIF